MLDLRIRLANLLKPYLEGFYPGNLFSIFSKPPKNSSADIALPCFIPAKGSGTSPKDLAARLADAVPPGDLIKSLSPEGPYLNICLDTKLLLSEFAGRLKGTDPFTPFLPQNDKRPVLIEYSQPNTHKLFHIGHIRNVAVGDTLVRVLRYNGRNIVSLNYIGDIGAHIAKFLWFFQRSGRSVEDFRDGTAVGSLYVDSSLYLEALDEKGKKEAREEISCIQKALEDRSSPGLLKLWKITRRQSIEYFDEIYGFLNASFDRFYFESDVEKEGIDLIKEYYKKGVFKKSRGAIVAELGGSLDTFLLLKSDGTSLYSTKDIALALRKDREYNPALSLYIVGSEQVLYFRQLIETLNMMGFEKHDTLRHISYELVTLKDEKMSSRYGNVVSFHDLKKAIYEKILTSYLESRDWEPARKEETLYKIALATIRYGMVSKSLNKKITFNLEEWLKPEGDTGAYILYTIARINSIISKANSQEAINAGYGDYQPEEIERSIIVSLSEFSYMLRLVEEKLEPSLLANYIFDLCKDFNRFYHQFPVLRTSPGEFAFRFSLINAVKAVVEKGISLLGFYPVLRM